MATGEDGTRQMRTESFSFFQVTCYLAMQSAFALLCQIRAEMSRGCITDSECRFEI